MLDIIINMLYQIFEESILVLLALVSFSILKIKLKSIYFAIFIGVLLSYPMNLLNSYPSEKMLLSESDCASASVFFLISFLTMILSLLVLFQKNNEGYKNKIITYLSLFSLSLIVNHKIHELTFEAPKILLSNYYILFFVALYIILPLVIFYLRNKLISFLSEKNLVYIVYILLSLLFYQTIEDFFVYSGLFNNFLYLQYNKFLYIFIFLLYLLYFLVYFYYNRKNYR